MSSVFEISHDWEEPDGLQDLLNSIRGERPGANLKRIRYAYYLAEKGHAGQLRASGEPFITHPLAVAKILADLHMDDDTIIAALLHDVLEDTEETTDEHIKEFFGDDVLSLVDGVTKLKFKPVAEMTKRQRAAAETARMAETLRKMLLAMAKDFRVMVIKLADRLHNMQTLDPLPPEKRVRIANETLDVYAPLAARLGIWQLKWQLEDLAFRHLHPDEYKKVEESVSRSREERERDLTESILKLKERLAERGVKLYDVHGRPKHLYSIFNKMIQQGLEFNEIHDLLALRVIVETTNECYQALGTVHELWVPIEGLFSDYIAKPKPNGYQSLHTKVLGPHGSSLEVQIRTRHMHEVAEYGVAAHWTYKEGSDGKPPTEETNRLGRLREQLFDWSSDGRTSSDFLRSLSTDLFSEQVFVFTPKGDVIDLPRDSTPVDFAFRVHSQLGLTLVGAKVNGAIVQLSSRLSNGDVVELITRSTAQPSIDWMEFVKSAHTRSKLRSFFRRQSKTEDAQRGRDALERELRAQKIDPKHYLGEDRLNGVAKEVDGCDNATDVLARVGAGYLSAQSVVAKLRGPEAPQPQTGETIQTMRTREGKLSLVTGGLEHVVVNRAKCCAPIPGDEVVGYVSRGHGIMLHRKLCPNAMRYAQTEAERLLKFEWPSDGNSYAVNLKITSVDRQGLLADITTILAEARSNLSAARIKTNPNQTADIEITIDVTDTTQLQALMTKMASFADVISIYRLFGRTAAR